jgi:hypothetical protein
MADRDNVKFWTVLAATILVVSVMVMLIDMSIKAAILEESNALRLAIEGQRNGRGKEESDNNRANSNGSGTPNVLGEYDPRVEAGNVLPSDTVSANPRPRRRAKPKASGDSREIPPGD